MTRERSITFPRRVIVAGVLVAASAGLLVSCSSSGGSSPGSSSTGASTSTPPAGSGDTVQVKNFAFAPGDLSVAKGTTVTWDFDDSTAHTVTSTTNAFGSKGLTTGGKYSFTFNTAGKYDYICTYHQYMKGTITVK